MQSESWHYIKAQHGPGYLWVWEAGDAPADGEWGYSYAALTDNRQQPPNYNASKPRPTDVNIPVVEFNDNWLPPLDGDIYVGTSGSDTGMDLAPPVNPPFRILPSTILEAESQILVPLNSAVAGKDGYDELKAYVERVGGWVFYRPEDATIHDVPSQDAVDAARYLDLAVSATADCIMKVGMFLNRLNQAGQIYVLGDQQSTFPSQ
jgi:hypothetical protein